MQPTTRDMMRKMDMPMTYGTMPSLQEQMRHMQALDSKTGADFDIAFLREMSEQHAMAMMMAAAVLLGGLHSALYERAATIVEDQGKEIEQIRTWLQV